MATEFIKKTEIVKKMVELETLTTVNTGVNLELTLEEAYTLAEVYSQVAGEQEYSGRKHFKSIANKLKTLGIIWKYGCNGDIFDKTTFIGFTFRSLNIINEEAKILAHQK